MFYTNLQELVHCIVTECRRAAHISCTYNQ